MIITKHPKARLWNITSITYKRQVRMARAAKLYRLRTYATFNTNKYKPWIPL